MSKGFFISFEGIDGVGKTTQVRMLVDHFTRLGKEVLWTKEPGDIIDGARVGSNIGPQIREMLFHNPTTNSMAPGVSDMLFLADCLQNMELDIKPALAAGRIVICDRYVDSQYAYSPYHGSPTWCNPVYRQAVTLLPDATILLTGDPEVLAHRMRQRVGKEGSKQDGKVWAHVMTQLNIQQVYLHQLQGLPRTVIIDVGHKSQLEVFVNVIAALESRMKDMEMYAVE